ncbi:cytochrome c3 family protein [Comamonas sp. 23]
MNRCRHRPAWSVVCTRCHSPHTSTERLLLVVGVWIASSTHD